MSPKIQENSNYQSYLKTVNDWLKGLPRELVEELEKEGAVGRLINALCAGEAKAGKQKI